MPFAESNNPVILHRSDIFSDLPTENCSALEIISCLLAALKNIALSRVPETQCFNPARSTAGDEVTLELFRVTFRESHQNLLSV